MQMRQFKPCPQRAKMSKLASMEKWQKFEYFHLNYSAVLSDKKANEVASSLATDKTYLQLK